MKFVKPNLALMVILGLALQKPTTGIGFYGQHKKEYFLKKQHVTKAHVGPLKKLALFFFPQPQRVLDLLDRQEILRNKTKSVCVFTYI